MDFVTPKELSLKYNVSLKTIYNYITKRGSKIHTRKEFWKTLFSLKDFEDLFTKGIQNLQQSSQKNTESKSDNILWNIEKNFEKLQNDYKIVSQEKNDLQNYNLVLQDQATKYALLFNDEKTERKELFQKYEILQEQHRSTSLQYEKEKANRAKYFYLLLWITIITLVVLIILNWKDILEQIR